MNKPIEVTDVQLQIFSRPDEFDILGYCSLVLNHSIKLSNIAIRRDETGLRLTYPAKKTPDGKKFYHCYPINSTVSNILTEAVTNKLNEVSNGKANSKNS